MEVGFFRCIKCGIKFTTPVSISDTMRCGAFAGFVGAEALHKESGKMQ